MKKRAVIFDMDGVLIDSEPVYLGMFRQFIEENGGTVKEETLKAIAGASGRQTWVYMAQMWKEEIDSEELHREFRRQYPDFQIDYKGTLYPEIEDLLKYLKDKGMRIALASSASDRAIGRMLNETGFAPYFDCLISGDMFQESKPNPEIYLHTMSCLDLKPEDCVVMEDSTYGIQAAKAAGLEVVAVVDHRFGFDQSLADHFVERTADMMELFENLFC